MTIQLSNIKPLWAMLKTPNKQFLVFSSSFLHHVMKEFHLSDLIKNKSASINTSSIDFTIDFRIQKIL